MGDGLYTNNNKLIANKLYKSEKYFKIIGLIFVS